MASHRRPQWNGFSASSRRLFVGAFVVMLVASSTSRTEAQGVGAVGGVYIDPAGMLRESSNLSQVDLRRKLRDEAGPVEPSQPVSATSSLRKISLRRLEEAVADLHRAGQSLPADIRCLAGLTAI